jgi:hypothetical protein
MGATEMTNEQIEARIWLLIRLFGWASVVRAAFGVPTNG